MRFYLILITQTATSAAATTPTGGATPAVGSTPVSSDGIPFSWTSSSPLGINSIFGGGAIPGAQDVALDIFVGSQADEGTVSGMITIWGVSVKQIAQATNLKGMNMVVLGGMQKGLPLANPAQQGLLLKGEVYTAYGNWIGNEQTLNLVFSPSTGGPSGSVNASASSTSSGPVTAPLKPANIVHNWKKGQPLSSAVQSALSVAFPSMTTSIQISSQLVLPRDDIGYFQTLRQYSQYLQAVSQKILGTNPSGNYLGVTINLVGSQISVYDGSVPSSTIKQINIQDLVGQPTWGDSNQIIVSCVMRGDINVGDTIQLPQTFITQTPNSSLLTNQFVTFTGQCTVNKVHHVGRFRQPEGTAWMTQFNCYPIFNQGISQQAIY